MDRLSVEQLTAFSLPSRLPMEGDSQREQRNWIVRQAEDLSAEFNADDVSRALTTEAVSAVAKARASRGLEDRDAACSPLVRLVLLDERHLVVNVITIKQEEDDAHEYLVAASAVLSVLDKSAPIEEIQGIPRRFWRLLIGEPR